MRSTKKPYSPIKLSALFLGTIFLSASLFAERIPYFLILNATANSEVLAKKIDFLGGRVRIDIPQEVMTVELPANILAQDLTGIQSIFSGPVPMSQLSAMSLMAKAAGTTWNKMMVNSVQNMGSKAMGTMRSLVASQSFTPVNNIQISLSDRRAQVSWDAVENATLYDVSLVIPQTNKVGLKTITAGSTVSLPLVAGMDSFQVYVTPRDEDIVGVKGISNIKTGLAAELSEDLTAPTLTSPANNIQTDGFLAVLEWTGHDNKNVRLQLSTNEKFSEVFIDEVFSQSEFEVPADALTIGQKVYWRSQVWDTQKSPWSSVRSLTVGDPVHVHKDMFINPEAPH